MSEQMNVEVAHKLSEREETAGETPLGTGGFRRRGTGTATSWGRAANG
jgi:hypothetical protein